MTRRELNSVIKRRYSISIGLLYPSNYRASLSSLALNILYFYLNGIPEVYAERIVLDVNDGMRSIETGKSINKFDYIMVLSAYELDYPIALSMLNKAGVNPIRERRDERPVILWGGPSPTSNPLPLYNIADAVLRGEAEAFLDEFIDIAISHSDKRRFIEGLSELSCAWIPSIKEDSTIARVADLDSAFYPLRQIQSLEEEPFLGRAFIVEPSRGCARGCRFCLEGAIYGVRRERSYEKLARIIEEGLELNRVDKIAFYTLSFFDSELGDRLLELLLERKIEGSVPSVRADSLNERRVELVRLIGQRTLTIAPETPSDRLQRLINKTISRETVLNVAKWAKRNGLSLKLYYMYGLPGETMEELALIPGQVEEIYRVFGSRKAIKVSIVPFTPKPMTYMWREKMLDLRELKRRERFLKERIRKYAHIEAYPPRLSILQYKINSLGREASGLLLSLADINIMRSENLKSDRRGLEELG